MLSCDIEDGFESERTPRPIENAIVHTKFRAKHTTDDEPNIQSDVGWDKTIYARTWGCAHNGNIIYGLKIQLTFDPSGISKNFKCSLQEAIRKLCVAC